MGFSTSTGFEDRIFTHEESLDRKFVWESYPPQYLEIGRWSVGRKCWRWKKRLFPFFYQGRPLSSYGVIFFVKFTPITASEALNDCGFSMGKHSFLIFDWSQFIFAFQNLSTVILAMHTLKVFHIVHSQNIYRYYTNTLLEYFLLILFCF